MGSALFFILGAFAFPSGDPTRVAAQIVTGIGFLGAGVIVRHGSAVSGLNTAATLWTTAAVGALAGAWMWREAVAGAVIVVAGNLLLYPLTQRMDRRTVEGPQHTESTRFAVWVHCEPAVEQVVRGTLLAALRGSGFVLVSVRSSGGAAGGDAVEVRAEVTGGEVTALPQVVAVVGADVRVQAAGWLKG